MTPALRRLLAIAAAGGVVACGAVASTVRESAVDWPVFAFDPARSAVDPADRAFSARNVGRLRERWQTTLGDVADSTPVMLARVRVGERDLAMLFQTAKDGTTYGIDARSGRIVWRFETHGPNITTSTPAADPADGLLFVPGVDGFVHALDPATGSERRGRGFPVRVTQMPETEKDAAALNVANGYLYAATSGYIGDAPPYDGHVVAVRLRDGATHVFNTLCSTVRVLPDARTCNAQRSGIWARAGVVVDPDPALGGRVYVATGNGPFDAAAGGHDYGDSVLALTRDVTRLVGFSTPRDYAELDASDADLGSTAPALFPRQPRSRTPLMAAQGGKDAILRLLDRAHLGGVGGELQRVALPAGLFSAPAVARDPHGVSWLFLGFPQSLVAYRLETGADGRSRLVRGWAAQLGGSTPEGTSPVVAGGVVFAASSGVVQAFDAWSGRTLWDSRRANVGGTIGALHWQSPIAVGGWVYCSDQGGHLTAYASAR